MSELSNAVTVLIARMESHPEDFGVAGMAGRPKFYDVANALYGLVGMDKEMAGSYWFLDDADKEALIEAWKKYHRVEMEKEVMRAIFDDGSEERDRKAAYQASMQKAMAQQALTQQQAAMNSYPYTVNAAQQAQGMTVSTNGAVSMANTLSLGGETIDSSLLKKLKDLVK